MNAPKLRFKEFNGDWNSNAIGKFLKIKSGLGFKAEEYTTEEEIRLLQIENVGYGTVKWTHNVKFVPSNYLDLHKDLVLKEGDLVLALNRPVTNDQLKIAKLTKEDSPSILYQRVGKLNFLKEDFDRDFIFQIFQKDVKSYVLNSSIGSDQPFISITDLYKHKLCIPPKEEQTKIATFLSAVDEKISQLSQKLHLLSQYKQGMMQKLFSQQIRFKADDGSEFREWNNKVLNDIAEIIGGGTPSTNNEEYWNGDVIWLTPSEINKKFIIKSKRMISELGVQKSSAKKLPIGTILFTSRATIGEVAIAATEVTTNQGFQSFITKKNMFNEFLYYWIIKNRQQFIERASGSTFLEISKSKIQSMEILLPCLEEQTKIADFLSAIDQKIDVVSEQLEQAKLWKKGLLQQMFV